MWRWSVLIDNIIGSGLLLNLQRFWLASTSKAAVRGMAGQQVVLHVWTVVHVEIIQDGYRIACP